MNLKIYDKLFFYQCLTKSSVLTVYQFDSQMTKNYHVIISYLNLNSIMFMSHLKLFEKKCGLSIF